MRKCTAEETLVLLWMVQYLNGSGYYPGMDCDLLVFKNWSQILIPHNVSVFEEIMLEVVIELKFSAFAP